MLNLLSNKIKTYRKDSDNYEHLINELESYRDELLEKKKIRDEKDIQQEDEQVFRQKIYELTGTEHGSYEYLPDEFKDTIYEKNRLHAEAYTDFTLSPHVHAYYHSHFATDPYLFKSIPNLHMFIRCDGVVPAKEGPRLIIRDPYGSFVTEPVTFISLADARSMIGRVLALEITFVMLGGDKIKVNRIKKIRIPFSGDKTIPFPSDMQKE